ncbi:hypothetical protein MRV_0038 [Murid herpesvirus 3]|uniref:Uncharacterized protein n=2 Tax=Murid betaherpesvirus 3 TaxID=2560603 RepID=A0A1P8VIS0_9BETA|nr:hypothetical protein MRV_0038 [Murine roseolovirus]APZ76249.1 hypothetical protein MRV_0038 [Murid betaherpesvirus 3]AYH64792.1 hypothetical protein MRV_0038 [Murid herpesvirus 3]
MLISNKMILIYILCFLVVNVYSNVPDIAINDILNGKIEPYISEWIILLRTQENDKCLMFYFSRSGLFLFKELFYIVNNTLDVFVAINVNCYYKCGTIGIFVTNDIEISKKIPNMLSMRIIDLPETVDCVNGQCLTMLNVKIINLDYNYVIFTCKEHMTIKLFLAVFMFIIDIWLLYYILMLTINLYLY